MIVKLELAEQEVAALQSLIDASLRAAGLQAFEAASTILVKLATAVQAAQQIKAEPPVDIKRRGSLS